MDGVAWWPVNSDHELLCLFCGRVRGGGVAGPALDVYICPDCVRLAAKILDEQNAPNELS